MHKDLGLALDLAEENQVPVAMTTKARQLFEQTQAAGFGRDDYTALLKVLEQLTGVEVRTKQ
jgi:3-hydroxyisobutyrate dehydrogenase-like beta-hydroxyacid dehydrogenase